MNETNEFSITGRTFAVSERSQKTTRRFMKNKPLFSKSDTSFYEKQAVVLDVICAWKGESRVVELIDWSYATLFLQNS